MHLYIETKISLPIDLITGLIREKPNLQKIFSENLVSHLTNCLQHVKMLPIYLQMGYEKKNFIADSSLNKCDIVLAKRIKKRFKILGIYNRLAIDNYIGRYIAMKADVSGINYFVQLEFFYITDKMLYEILDKFWNKWENFDILKSSASDYWRDDFAGELIDSIEEWMKMKTIR